MECYTEPHAAGGGGQPVSASAAAAYIEQANRAQFLLNHGHVAGAREVFQKLLVDRGEGPSYQRAVLLERMGFCYLIEGQPLMAAGLFQQATEAAEALELSDGVRSLQGVIQSELGEAFDAAGYPVEARRALETALEIAADLGDARAQGVDFDHLGLLALKEGNAEEARSHFEAALSIFHDLGQPAPKAVAQQHLASAFEAAGAWEEAETNYVGAAQGLKACGNISGCSQLYAQAAVMNANADRLDQAEALYRTAVDESRPDSQTVDLRRHIAGLSQLLQRKGGRLDEIRALIEEALAASETSLDADIWMLYGQLAGVIEQQAGQDTDQARRGLAEAEARQYRHVQQFAPRLMATLESVGEEASYGRAVVLERLARCCLLGGRPAPAVILLQQGLDGLDQLQSDESVQALQGVLRAGLGEAFGVAGFTDASFSNHEASLVVAETLGNLRGQLTALSELGGLAKASGQSEQAAARLRAALGIADKLGEPQIRATIVRQLESLPEAEQATDVEVEPETVTDEAPSRVSLREDATTQCAFGTDLLIDVHQSVTVAANAGAELPPLPGDARPMMVPRVRTALDGKGDLRFYIPAGEPALDQHQACIVMRNVVREVAVAGDLGPAWALIRLMDGMRSVETILARTEEESRAGVAQLLSVLAKAGAIDVSGRPTARFLHAATKKGFLAGGGLEGDKVIGLVTDGGYRTYDGAPRIEIERDVPDALSAFHALSRLRRSKRNYSGEPLQKEQLAALLETACGLTGTASWDGSEVSFRSYPSSGALYAVEIYPVALNIEGIDPAIYHYLANESALESVRPLDDPGEFVSACLPVEREMVGGAATVICLTGHFRRHETKYGEGGYRMMVAEAGHISQNLILAATALGLSARPFGGVFDTLINRQLGLDEDEEQFLLSVLVGHAAKEGNGPVTPDARS